MGVFFSIAALTLLFGLLLRDYTPWWMPFMGVMLSGLVLGKSSWRSFFAGFFAVGLVWLAMAGYYESVGEGRLTHRIAILFNLPNKVLLLVITSFLGGLLGGLASVTGTKLRQLFTER